jgi:glucose-1-phosphate cytidylyltransferase
MIPIDGRPILWHIMKGYAHHGFTDFVLCLGYKSWVIKRYFLDYHLASADFSIAMASPDHPRIRAARVHEDWQVTLAETGLHAMTGCRIKRIEPYIIGDTFMLTYGDGVADIDLTRLLAFHRSHGKIGTVTTVCPPGRFGEIETEGDQIVEFMEKPLLSRGRISGGFFVFHRAIFQRLSDDPDLVFENDPLVRLARDGELMAYQHDGFWHPMDSSRDYNFLNSIWIQGRAPWACWETGRPRQAA